MLKNEDFGVFKEKNQFSEHIATWLLLLLTSNFFECKPKVSKAPFIPHIRTTGPIKKLEAPEFRLLPHMGRIKKIWLTGPVARMWDMKEILNF